MKKTYFTCRDDEGKIFDRGFMIEGQDEKELQAVANYLEGIYPELVTFFDGVIKVHYVKNVLGVDVKTFKSVFNMYYADAKKAVAAENTEPAASTEKPLTITRYNEGRGKHFDFVRVTGGSVKEYRKARTLARNNLTCNSVIEGFDYIDFYGVTVEAVKRAIEPAAELVEAKEKPAKKIATYTAKNTKKKKQRRIAQINKALDLLGDKCTLYTAIHCLSYVQNKKHRNGYFIGECVA